MLAGSAHGGAGYLALEVSSELALDGAVHRLAGREDIIVCALADGRVCVWSVRGLAEGALPGLLQHPGRSPPHVAVGPDRTVFTGDRDVLLTWEVRESDGLCLACSVATELRVHGRQGRLPAVHCAAFACSPGTGRLGTICLGLGETVHLFRADTGAEDMRLEGHLAPVTACAFTNVDLRTPGCAEETAISSTHGTGSPGGGGGAAGATYAERLLISASEDRTFKVWDLCARALVYTSAVLGASPLTAIAVDRAASPIRLAVGCEDGSVLLHELVWIDGGAGAQAQGHGCTQGHGQGQGQDFGRLPLGARHIRTVVPHALVPRCEAAGAHGGRADFLHGGSSAGAGERVRPYVVTAAPASRRSGGPATGVESVVESGVAQTSHAVLLLSFVHRNTVGNAGRDRLGGGGEGGRVGGSGGDGGSSRGGGSEDRAPLGESWRRRVVADQGARKVPRMGSLLVGSCSQLTQVDGASFAVAPLEGGGRVTAGAAHGGCVCLTGAVFLEDHGLLVLSHAFARAIELHVVRPAVRYTTCVHEAAVVADAAAAAAGAATDDSDASPFRVCGADPDDEGEKAEGDDAAEGHGSSTAKHHVLIHDASAASSEPRVSLRANSPPPKGSPLARALAMTHDVAGAASARSARSAGYGGDVLTREVKSSGYGTRPIMRLHTGGPATLAARLRRLKARRAEAAAPGRERGAQGLEARMAYNPGREGAAFTPVPSPPGWAAQPLHASAALRCSYTPDGSRLASATTGGTLAIVRLPALKHGGESATLVGHRGAVRSAQWSHSGRLVITASDDGTACVWDADPTIGTRSEPVLRIAHLRFEEPARVPAAPAHTGTRRHASLGGAAGVARGPAAAAGGVRNPPLGAEVRAACFFYLDQLALLACGPSLFVYSLQLPQTGAGRGAAAVTSCSGSAYAPRYRLSHRWEPGAQQVLDVCAPNAFISATALVSTSDRTLHAYDLGAGATKLRIAMADLRGGGHTRPVRCVRHAPEAGDTFLTSAPDSTVRLWDLRAGACVRCFSAHTNRQHGVGCAFSPCMNYVAVGGEDKCASVYSLQSGTLVQTLQGHTDVVSDVAFHPRHPQVCTVAFDGQVRFFNKV